MSINQNGKRNREEDEVKINRELYKAIRDCTRTAQELLQARQKSEDALETYHVSKANRDAWESFHMQAEEAHQAHICASGWMSNKALAAFTFRTQNKNVNESFHDPLCELARKAISYAVEATQVYYPVAQDEF